MTLEKHYLERYQKLVKRLCVAYHTKDEKEIPVLVYALSNLHDEILGTNILGDARTTAEASSDFDLG